MILNDCTCNGGLCSLKEAKFREFFSKYGNASERYEFGKKVVIYTLHRGIDNKFNLSYHLKFCRKNVQFNFWFDKISHINSNESVTISFYNGNENFEKDRLKNILKTSCLNEFEKKIHKIFNEYR